MRKAVFIAAAVTSLWLAPGALAAGWCGTGESPTDLPDVTTGPQMHAIVATPADVPDEFGTVANKLADDIASMSAWWTGQDPTRVPRYDLATFPGGTCPDISFVHLPQPASAYTGSSSFSAVVNALVGAGFENQFKNYVVYYDGPSVLDGVCGTGGGDFDTGTGFAIVWLNGCAGVPTDGIEAHELLHALGALPAGAPNFCRPDTDPVGKLDPNHPCDSPTDVLYPYADNSPLAQKVLDFNHDDYYAHSGTWNDLQDSIFLQHLDAPPVPLALTFSGDGLVTSDLPGVSCTATCTTQWQLGTTVTLSASPAATSRFIRWTGGCTGNAGCVLNLAQPASVTALFGPLTVPVKISTTGRGGVKCLPGCSQTFSAGDALSLRAVPAKGWKFAGWGGACAGTRITCAPKTDFALAVHATFKKLPAPKPKPKAKPKKR